MREWLSGRAPPCQGGGRGFDPRLALTSKKLETFRNKGFEGCKKLETFVNKGFEGFDPRLALTSKKLETFRNKGFELFCFIRNCVPILHKAKKTP